MTALRHGALAALALLALPACDSDPIMDEDDDGTMIVVERAAFVGNAGNFAENNGSVTRYGIDDGAVSTPLPTDSLGGLVQNLAVEGGDLFVLLNFSDSFDAGTGRVDVYDLDLEGRTRQDDVSVPRGFGVAELGPLSDGQSDVLAYWTTNLYAGTATRLTADGTEIVAEVGDNPEGVAVVGDRVYVANSGFGFGSSLSVVDRTTGADRGTVGAVCTGPRTLAADAEGDVWVVCTGTSDFNTGEVTAPGEVVVVTGATGAVAERFVFEDQTIGSATLGQDASLSLANGELYVIADGGVVRFDTATNARGATIPVEGAVGAVGYDAETQRLYVGRPNADSPFGDDGFVTLHDRDGAEVGRFDAGIAPVAIVFGVTSTQVPS